MLQQTLQCVSSLGDLRQPGRGGLKVSQEFLVRVDGLPLLAALPQKLAQAEVRQRGSEKVGGVEHARIASESLGVDREPQVTFGFRYIVGFQISPAGALCRIESNMAADVVP
jgi:hypothetical protein